MKSFTILLSVYFFTAFNLNAQIDVVGACNEINSIHELSTLDGFSFDLSQNTSTSNLSFCDSSDPIETPNWLAFTVRPYLEYDFQISFNNCSASQSLEIGGQLAIYEDCDDLSNSIYCQSTAIIGTHEIPNDLGLEAGKTYYLLMDGANSMICDVTIHVEKYMPMEAVTDWFSVSGSFSGPYPYSYSAIGDTIINNQPYRIIISEPDLLYNRYLREDKQSKKVYTYNEFNGQESLLYDFAATIGDVISYTTGSYVVIDIDYIDGEYGELKRWKLDGPGPPIYVTEGIGSEDLFLSNQYSDPVYSLSCAYHKTDKIYGNDFCSPSSRWPLEIDVTICDGETYTIGGIVYTESGTYQDSLISQSGQDSLVTINLTVLPTNVTNLDYSVCEGEAIIIDDTTFDINNPTGTIILVNASANSCDSIINVSLNFFLTTDTLITQVACQGDIIDINEITYDISGTYNQQLISTLGCDSLITLVLDFLPIQERSDTLYFCEGDSVLINGTFVHEEGTFENTYLSSQGCDSIQNTITTFLPDSECINSTTDLALPELKISPNPFNNIFKINAKVDIMSLFIYNIRGEKLIAIEDINLKNYTIDGSLLTSGVYILMIQTENNIMTRKIMKD